MLLSMPHEYGILQLTEYLRRKSSLLFYEKYAPLKYKYDNRHSQHRGYYVSTAGCKKNAIEVYIMNRSQEGHAEGQLTMKEFVAPVGTRRQVKKFH